VDNSSNATISINNNIIGTIELTDWVDGSSEKVLELINVFDSVGKYFNDKVISSNTRDVIK